MPSIKDKSTVQALAREFTSNGRKKGEAMLTVGYEESYAIGGGRGCEVVFSNDLVIEEIKRLDNKAVKRAELTIDLVLEDLQWALDEAKERTPPDLTAIARLSELRGKYLSMFSESGNNAATGLSLNFSIKGPSKPVEGQTIKIR